MSRLVDDILDFARGKLEGGIGVSIDEEKGCAQEVISLRVGCDADTSEGAAMLRAVCPPARAGD